MDSMSRLLGLSLAAAFLLNHLSKGFRDVYMFPQNCLNIEDGVENQQILNTVSSLGDAEIQRNMWLISTYQTSSPGYEL